MAKKRTSLKDKLKSERINRKQEDDTLSSKKPLISKAKNTKAIEEQVAKIHGADEKKPSPPPKEEVVRLTVDVTKSMHKKVKIKMAEMEMKIQWYLFNLIKEDLEKD